LQENQAVIEDALSPLGTAGHGWVGGEGAIYYWAKLPLARAQQQQHSADILAEDDTAGNDGAAAAAQGGSNTEASNSDAAAARALASGDEAVVEWLIQQHGVCIIPGSACGAPGYVRVAFANLKPEQCKVAAGRLKAGFQQLVRVAAGVQAFASAAAC
jgi:aspartate/methionine/tyrosine aminotransferase